MTKALATEHELKQKACSEHAFCFNSCSCNRARVETEGVLRGHQQPCCNRNCGGEKERRFHSSRPLSSEDQDKAGHESGREDHVWQRDQGEGKASKDHREGLPSVCIEEADLECCSTALF